jgi:hypothetical protein
MPSKSDCCSIERSLRSLYWRQVASLTRSWIGFSRSPSFGRRAIVARKVRTDDLTSERQIE